MCVTINNKILNLKIFLLTQHIMPKSAKFQNNGKSNTPSEACAPPRGTIFLSEILILVSFISYLSMVEKAKWFFDGKKFNFYKQQGRKFQKFKIFVV